MNAIETYLNSKQRLDRFNRWASMIGKEYFGGTRGKGGRFGEIVSASGSLTIYHQEYDGANNYHKLDCEFDGELGFAIAANGPAIVEHIRNRLEQNVKDCAAQALKLTVDIHNDANKT